MKLLHVHSLYTHESNVYERNIMMPISIFAFYADSISKPICIDVFQKENQNGDFKGFGEAQEFNVNALGNHVVHRLPDHSLCHDAFMGIPP